MNKKFLEAIEKSSELEVDLTPVLDLVTKEDIIQLAKIRPNLESLIVNLPDDDALQCLILFKNLKKLFINEATSLSRKSEWLDSVCCLTNLTHLAINNYEDINENFMKKLTCLEKLIVLNFRGSYRIYNENVQYLSKFKELRFLNLNNSHFLTDLDMPFISSLNYLEGLEIADTGFTSIAFDQLYVLDKLKYLSLGSTDVTDENLKLLSTHLRTLEAINLFQCDNVTINGLFYLFNLENLKYLFINDGLLLADNQLPPSVNIIKGVNRGTVKFWRTLTKQYTSSE
jgi:hypothetical protein